RRRGRIENEDVSGDRGGRGIDRVEIAPVEKGKIVRRQLFRFAAAAASVRRPFVAFDRRGRRRRPGRGNGCAVAAGAHQCQNEQPRKNGEQCERASASHGDLHGRFRAFVTAADTTEGFSSPTKKAETCIWT